MLKWNASKVRNLNEWEIWLFIIARVLVALGIGALAEQYYPDIAQPLAIPVLIVGIVLFVIAGKGMFRKPPI